MRSTGGRTRLCRGVAICSGAQSKNREVPVKWRLERKPSCLDGHVPEQELDLRQLATSAVTQQSTPSGGGDEMLRCEDCRPGVLSTPATAHPDHFEECLGPDLIPLITRFATLKRCAPRRVSIGLRH